MSPGHLSTNSLALGGLSEWVPLVGPDCGADMRILAFISEAAPSERILNHIGEPPQPPAHLSRPLRWAS